MADHDDPGSTDEPAPPSGDSGEHEDRAHWDDVAHRWSEVGERFQALGSQLRQQWEETRGDEDVRGSQRSIDAALQQIADAAGRVVQAISESVKESGARQEATRAASSLADAFADTVQTAADEVRRRMGGRSEPQER